MIETPVVTVTKHWRVDRMVDGIFVHHASSVVQRIAYGSLDAARLEWPNDLFRLVEVRTLETVLE